MNASKSHFSRNVLAVAIVWRNQVVNRREILAAIAGTGLGAPLFHRALTGLVQEETQKSDAVKVTSEMVQTAEWISGTEFTDDERKDIANSVNRSAKDWQKLRKQKLDFHELPAVHFQPLSGTPRKIIPLNRSPEITESSTVALPDNEEDIAFLPVFELASFIRQKKISSVELTKIYLSRLEKYNPMLNCVVSMTDDLAMKQAKKADQEIAAGRYRGPLHGIPWGAKDLMAVPGYPTTWGIPQFENRELPYKATVAQRLEDAGAVLVAKLSLGAIAMGDRWFRGMTRSPWNYKVGSSGSSAGSASATVAGLVGFSIGTETLGSIVSPARRCGATGFRPTFGRVSRHGCMPLSWTMDKLGPITRSVEDSALVFAAMHGYDGQDPTVHDWPFQWPKRMDLKGIKVGYTEMPKRRGNDNDKKAGEKKEDWKGVELELLKQLGCELVKIELPEEQAQRLLANTIGIEAGSVFDEMLRAGETEGWNTWPRTFRAAQFTSAIDYLRIQRCRRQLQIKFEEVMKGVDCLVNCNDLLITNLTGHPSVVLPAGYSESRGRKTPYSALFTGQLNDDDRLLAIALAFQNQMTAHLERPPLDELMKAKAAEDAKKSEADKKFEADKKSEADKKAGG